MAKFFLSFIFFISLLLIFLVTQFFLTIEDASLPAAGKGMEWLLSDISNFNDPAVAWILKNINDNYCNSDEIEQLISSQLKRYESYPIEKAYIRLFEEGYQYSFDYEVLKNFSNTFDDLLIPAIYCDRQEIPDEVLSRIENYENSYGYELTHIFLAASFMRDRGCIDGSMIDQMAKKIAFEQNMSDFNDLYAERQSLLLYYGYEDLVDVSWSEEITSSQQDNGGWYDYKFNLLSENPHTTALATWALTQQANSCPI